MNEVATRHTEDGRQTVDEWQGILKSVANSIRVDTVLKKNPNEVLLVGQIGGDRYEVRLKKG